MENTWKLKEAQHRFSEVVERAIHEGPQEVSQHGEKAVVVLASADYERLQRGTGNLADFLRSSPLRGLDLERLNNLPHDIEL